MKERNKKKKKPQFRMIIALLAILLLAGVDLWLIRMDAGDSQAVEVAAITVKEPLLGVNQDGFQSKVNQEVTDVVNAGKTAAVGDRSNFAVKEGETVGNPKASEEKTVYLTLDDGPSVNTQKVLDILDQYNCKATFFVTNINPEYKDMIKKAYDKGHTIGLHTYSHDYAKLYASEDAYFEDLNQIGEVVKEQIGYVPAFIRFPGGSSNGISREYTKGIMTQLVKDTTAKGYQYYDWNCSSGDGGNCTTEQLIANATSVNYTNIMLLSHDSNGKENTVAALPSIIEHYQSQGYVFKAIDKESFVSHHKVGN